MEFVKYYVNKIGTDKYLHTTTSRYGENISLTDGILYADWYDEQKDAISVLNRYVSKTKTAKFDMFSIQKTKIKFDILNDVKYFDALHEVTFNLSSYGIIGEDCKKIDEEWINAQFEKQYKVKPKSFTFEIVQNQTLIQTYGQAYNFYYNCEVKNIIW